MVHSSEYEQLEKLQQIWKKYGNYILTFILIVSILFALWRWIEQRNVSIRKNSSEIFMQAIDGFFANEKNIFLASSNKLFEEYPQTIYADFAHLLMAKYELEKNNPEKSKTHLSEVSSKGSENTLRDIAKIRLARILLNENQETESIKLLESLSSKAFEFLVHDLKGDIYLKKNDYIKAREEYGLALLSHKNGIKEFVAIVKMKLDNVPEHK